MQWRASGWADMDTRIFILFVSPSRSKRIRTCSSCSGVTLPRRSLLIASFIARSKSPPIKVHKNGEGPAPAHACDTGAQQQALRVGSLYRPPHPLSAVPNTTLLLHLARKGGLVVVAPLQGVRRAHLPTRVAPPARENKAARF